MLTTLPLDLPIAVSLALQSSQSLPDLPSRTDQLETRMDAMVQEHYYLMAALLAMWNSLNAPGSISITNATTIQGPETSLLRQMLLVGA